MTVREILLWLANKDDTIDYDAVERDLRKAFIREESVGTFDIKADGYPLLDNPFPLTLNKKPLRGWDEYDLIPHKETP